MSTQSTYTYNWQLQKYVPWKGVSRNEAVPGNARPITNGSWILEQEPQSGEDGNAFLPRPIKHWRRQLNPDKIRGGSNGTVIREVFQPGGTNYLGDNVDKQRSCCDNENNQGFKIISDISTSKNLDCCKSTPIIIKPATTILSKKYYSDTKAYLKRKCQPSGKSYIEPLMGVAPADYAVIEQLFLSVPLEGRSAWIYAERNSWQPWLEQQTGFMGRELTWDSETQLGKIKILWESRNAWKAIPSSEVEAVQLDFEQYAREATGQPSGNPFPLVSVTEIPVTICKPNNIKFAPQGAVDSSTYLDRLKLVTVNKSGASLRTVFGDAAAKAGSYKANGDTPYFIKSNYQPCVHFHRRGHHAKCFHINSSDLQRHNKLQGYK